MSLLVFIIYKNQDDIESRAYDYKKLTDFRSLDILLNEEVMTKMAGMSHNFDQISHTLDSLEIKKNNLVLRINDANITEELKALDSLFENKRTLVEDFERINPTLINSINSLPLLAKFLKDKAIDPQAKEKIESLLKNILLYYQSQTSEMEVSKIMADKAWLFSYSKQFKEEDVQSTLTFFLKHIEHILANRDKIKLLTLSILNVPTERFIDDITNYFNDHYEAKLSENRKFIYTLIILSFLMGIGIHFALYRLKKNQSNLSLANKDLNVANSNLRRTKGKLQDLTEQLRYYKLGLDQSAIVLTLDAYLNIIEVNDKCLSVTGYSKDELEGYPYEKLYSKVHQEEFYNNIEKQLSEKLWRGEMVLETKSKRTYWVDSTIVPFFNRKSEPYKYLSIIFDITDRKEAELELKNINVRLSDLNNTIEDKNLTLENTLKELKTAQDSLIQSEKMASLGQLTSGIAHEINTPLGVVNSGLNSISESVDYMYENLYVALRELDGKSLTILYDIINKSVESNNSTGFLESRKQQKYAIEKMKQQGIKEPKKVASLLATLDIFDFDSSYTPLLEKENSEVILRNAFHVVNLKKSVQNMISAVKKASKTIFALKSYSYFSKSDNKSKVSIIDSIEHILTLYRNQLKTGVEIKKHYSNVPHVFANIDELGQIWTNLLQNSIQAMENSGIITINVFSEGKHVVTTFEDNGPGIPIEIQEKIFEPFFTTKPRGEGSGLGLDIVKKIVDRHYGEIRFKSKPGKGTTFRIEIPINEKSGRKTFKKAAPVKHLKTLIS